MTFDEWYETFQRDGGELTLFNTIDLESAFVAGRAAGIAWAERFTAEQCVETIQQHHSIFKAGSWEQLALNGAVEKIEDKFKLKIKYR
jgi:hypothetical protein